MWYETPPPDALPALTALSEAARSNQAAALAFYRRALVIVAITALAVAAGLIWAGVTLSSINARGVCNARVTHTVDADVHLLIAGNNNPAKYVIPPLCH